MIISPLIRRIFKDSFLDSVKGIYNSDLRNEKFIRDLPRFTEYHTKLGHYSVSFPDAHSFLSMRDEIWHNQSYFFDCRTKSPYIIDCGSNIGLSVLYFKQLFPNSHIVAFEPDPILCNYLTQNVRTNALTEIEILPKAVWSSNTTLPFLSDGADGGRVSSGSNGVSVEAVMLNQFLDRDVDFLKIDIEGNELEVLKSCSDSLKNVSKIFLEYHSFKDSNQQLSDLLKMLEDNHFRYFLNSATPRTKPFAFKSNDEMDLQVNIYAWKN
ncbi:MAG: FkbM family methyltransferase [Opitutae bacterium]|nr:FkbM family methyltransferase [Opitutae bacterium]